MFLKIKNKLISIFFKFKIKKQQKLLFSNYRIDKSKNKKIIIFSAIGHSYMTPFEILMYHILRKKGYDVKYLIYNKDVPANEVITKERENKIGKNLFWNKSVTNAVRILNNSNVNYDFIRYNNSIFSSIACSVPKSIDDILTYEYDGINFGLIVKGSLYRYYKSLTFDENVFSIAMNNLKVSLSNYFHLKSIYNKGSIDIVLMSHGIYTSWEPIAEFCKKNVIKYVCYDRAKTKNHINLNINQNSPNWDFTSAWVRYSSRQLNKNENDLVDNYLKQRELQKTDVYSYNFSQKEKDIEKLKRKFKIKEDKFIITIFTNLIWDAANVSRDIAFTNPLECIIKTIDYFKNDSRVHVLVRSHPAEKVLGTQERYSDLILKHFKSNLPLNVTLIKPEDSINSFSVIEISDVGVVNTSTVGLEFAIEGKPIFLISETNYRNKGFTFDINDEKEYFSKLESQIKRIEIKENQVLLARKYFFIMMFLYQKKVPIKYKKGMFIGYEYNTFSELINHYSIKNIFDVINNIESKLDFVEWDKE